MKSIDVLDKQKYIFGRLISLSNRLQAIGDRYLSGDDITIRQWIMTIAVAQFGDTPPTLGEVSQMMNSSHQNVKQLAVNLEKNGFIHIMKDQKDGRVVRLKLTEKSFSFWKKRQEAVRLFLEELFKELNSEEISLLCQCLNKLYEGILKIENSICV